jgi:DNA modification methylase
MGERLSELVTLHVGDCIAAMREMPAGLAHTCVTSPPYFGLRSYLPNGVRLRDDLTDDQLAYVLAELKRHGVKPVAHTSE